MKDPRGNKRRLLILGGTAEAAGLARRAIDAHGALLDVISSLRGTTADPAEPPGKLRRGGFGGAAGLARYLRDESIGFLIDATHPFAARMQASAAEAAALARVPRCRLLRAAWPRHPGDRWIEAPDAAAAAGALTGLGRRVFLALGGRDHAAFAGVEGRWFLVRAISPLDRPPPFKDYEFLMARGPFTVEDESRLLKERLIDALVSRQSGGQGAYAKIEAARILGLPVVMIARPAPPPPPVVATVDAALSWLEGRLGD